MADATGYVVTGASAGHQLTSATWTVTLAPSGGTFTGTITATPNGGELFLPYVVTFTGVEASQTFSFTPLSDDVITFTFTNSGTLTDQTSLDYTSTRLYLEDTLTGTTGTTLQTHASNPIPGYPSGSAWTAVGGTANLVGGTSKLVYASVTEALYSSTASFPSSTVDFSQGHVGGQFEIQYDFVRASAVSGAFAGMIFMYDSFTDLFFLQYDEDNHGFWLKRRVAGETSAISSLYSGPDIGVTWRIRIDVINGNFQGQPNTPGDTTAFVSWSADNGSTWTDMFDPWWTTSGQPAFACAVYFQGNACSATTGPQIGNIVAQDIPPPPPNCHISEAYVTSSGFSLGFEFKHDTTNALVAPTVLNYLPAFFNNGTPIDVGLSGGVPTLLLNGASTRAVVLLAEGVQIDPGDVVTMSAPNSWMTCGVNNGVAGVTDLSLRNCVGISAFGTDSLVKTLKPGFNISLWGTMPVTIPVVLANLRYRLQPPATLPTTVDGYPTAIPGSNAFSQFFDFGNGGNGVDTTLNPGVPGYYAIGYDDNAYGTVNQCDLRIMADDHGVGSNLTSQVTITQITSCNNAGNDGIGQFYLFQVSRTSGATDANLPLGMNWNCPNYTSASIVPDISNLFILGPGDFDFTLGVPLSFDRTENPYRLNGHFLSTLPHGCGVIRFMDSFLGNAGFSNTTEPWEMRNLTDFSWNVQKYRADRIGLLEIRGLYESNSPYIYGDSTVFPISGETWTPLTSLSVPITLGGDVASSTAGSEGSITLSAAPQSGDAPFYGLLLNVGTGSNLEHMRVKGISGLTVTVERGSSTIPGSTTPAHSTGATITISSRWSWPSGGSNPLSNFGGPSTLVVEVLSDGPHKFKAGQVYFLSGSFPTMTFADSSHRVLYAAQVWPTGPTSYVNVLTGESDAGPEPTTLAPETTYTLDPDTDCWFCNEPDLGFPLEMIGKITSSIVGCNTYVCLPLMCSDSYAYVAFNKLLSNTTPGRKVYVELGDEIWNGGSILSGEDAYLGRFNSWKPSLWWSTNRTLQLRAIGREVFATAGRENEIQATLNVLIAGSPASQLTMAQDIGVPVDAVATAPYWTALASSGYSSNITTWNQCTSIPQMADLLAHETLFNPTNAGINPSGAHVEAIARYNEATGNNCVLIAYEGGYSTGSPNESGGTAGMGSAENSDISPYGYSADVVFWNHDIQYDPVWRIYEKDIYAGMQRFGYKDFAMYAYAFYGAYQTVWGMYRWAYQLPGKGDGSDGLFNNRTCLATPGQTYSKLSTTNQDELCVSVRGQAHIEWMTPPVVPGASMLMSGM